MRRFRILAVLIVVIGAALVGRQLYISLRAAHYEEHILDKSVLTYDPCAPPCWYGIVPGARMSLDQVEEIVRQVPSVGTIYRREEAVEWSWSGWSGSPHKKWRSEINSISNKDGKIRRVQLYPEFSLSVAQILELYGEPASTWSSQVGVPEHPYVALRMYYPTQGMVCVAEVMPWLKPVLKPETRVYETLYYEPAESLDAWIRNGLLRSDLPLAPMPEYGRMDEEFIERPTR